MRIHNQSMYNISATLNYMWWIGQLQMSAEDASALAHHISAQESTYITFYRFCQNVAAFDRGYKFFITTEEVDAKYQILYMQSKDGSVIVPLIVFTERHGVIENTIDIYPISTAEIPTGLQEVIQDELYT